MPRASWRGHLRLSLVSCPIYLSPATARTKAVRLHQVWQAPPPKEAGEPPTQHRERDVTDLRTSRPHSDQVEDRTEPAAPVSRITLRPHDPTTGEEIEKDEVVRGYEYERGQYVAFTPAGLKALDLERLQDHRSGDVCSSRRSRPGLFQ
jgi:DNA end-binding protein Ku